ncbi:glutamate ABC transporter substrate-binding protein [Leucobacter sp. USHLN153]|uniref:glutamate ABC transporter substrate-binding protein n=1 Tax=Leucobacter sp. USHLN153 TaxID=3081268 RepID=UPI003019B085
MKSVKKFAIAATVAALALTGCASDGASGSGDPGGKETSFPVAESVKIDGSPVFDRATEAGKLVIGVKEDQPGFGMRDSATGERSGFDIDLSKWVGAELGFAEDDLEFVLVPSQSREQSLQNGDADLIIGMYTISDKRKELVDFAGPYMADGQSILVREDYDDIKGESDLAGHKVCSITGSTPIQYIKENHPDAETVEFDNMAQCVEALTSKQVDAVSTDEKLLVGYTTLVPGELKVVGDRFTEEGFGIGIAKGNDSLRHYINDLLAENTDVLEKIYDDNLGASGTSFEKPQINDY